MMWIICLCITVLMLLVLNHAILHYSRCGRIVNKIPGLPPIPLFGNVLNFVIPNEQVWSKISYLFEKYYPIFLIWSFRNPVVFMRHPEDLKALLSCKKNISKSAGIYESLRDIDCDGLLSCNGQKWHDHRKILNYAFTTNHLDIYAEKINNRTMKLVDDLRSRENVFVENITPMLLKFALAAVCEAVMGCDTNNLPPEREKEYRDANNEFFDIAFYRTCRPYIRNFMMPFLSLGRRQKRVTKVLHDFRREIVQARRKYHESIGYDVIDKDMANTENSPSNNGLKELKKNLAVVDLLLLAEKKGFIDFHGVLEEVLTIAGAGYETTGMAISYLLTLLAENTEQQNLARAEILEVLGGDDCIKLKHMKDLVYLDRCVKESLRLFPTAPHLGRLITDDIRLNKHTLPAGSSAYVSLYDLHRDHHFWPEPNKFDPDRFLPENVKERHPFAYLPFSAGLRNCIGQKLATAEMKLVAAHILYNFYLEPIDVIANLKPEMHMTMKCNKINIKFIRIDRD